MRAVSSIGGALRSVRPDRRSLKADALAGVPGAIASVPDGMASAVLAGVNPIHGLYASFAGPTAGGFVQRTHLMVITTTTAAALAAGSAVASVAPDKRPQALFMLTVIAGLLMVGAGVAKLGRYTRFVSLSVMIGFLTGVAANILCSQIPDLTGAPSVGRFALAKAWNVITHPSTIDVASLLTGLAALAICFALGRVKKIAPFATIFALVIPTLATLGVAGVARVEDAGDIPTGVPLPHLPDFSLVSFDLLVGALAVTAIVLVQGAGVAESAPNPDGSPANADRDFMAQGIGNVASGLFRGQPVGGSVGQTALNRSAGARSRWAAIFSGIWMLAILVAFSGIVGRVAMPTLAAVLIYAAIGSIRVMEIRTIWRTSITSQVALSSTFIATLFLPIAAAVGVGVALSLLLQLNAEAMDLAVVELIRRPDGKLEERPAPDVLASKAVTVLDVYGSLRYAGARTLAARLPDPKGAESPAVVLRLRGRTTLGATAFTMLAGYAERLQAVGGRLFLSGVDPEVAAGFARAIEGSRRDRIRVFPASEVVGDSSEDAVRAAEDWLGRGAAPDGEPVGG